MKYIPIQGLEILNDFDVFWLDENNKRLNIKFISKKSFFLNYKDNLINYSENDGFDSIAMLETKHHNTLEIHYIKSCISLLHFLYRYYQTYNSTKECKSLFELVDCKENINKKELSEEFFENYHLRDGFFNNENNAISSCWSVCLGLKPICNDNYER